MSRRQRTRSKGSGIPNLLESQQARSFFLFFLNSSALTLDGLMYSEVPERIAQLLRDQRILDVNMEDSVPLIENTCKELENLKTTLLHVKKEKRYTSRHGQGRPHQPLVILIDRLTHLQRAITKLYAAKYVVLTLSQLI